MEDKLAIFYFEITQLWKSFCEEHNQLFNITCEEYGLLLKSELDLLEIKHIEKQEVIQKIGHLELIRKDLISDINTHIASANIKSVSELIGFMNHYYVEKSEHHLFRFNALLIDIIEKIQVQNKRNQLFINKALVSLKQIRTEALGKKNFSIYTSKGSAISSST